MIKAVRGTRDLLPPDTALWNFVETTARDVFRVYNFQEIRTPIFEETQLFARSVGEETDIVSKEMFTWWEGTPPSVALERGWRRRYQEEFDKVEEEVQLRPRLRVDFVAYRGNTPYLVELKSVANRATVQTAIQQLWMFADLFHIAHPSSEHPRLILAVPESQVPAAAPLVPEGIQVQGVPLEDYEPAQSLTLRPENTAGTVRAYIEHKLWERPGVQKLYYIGPQFRRERPQKGRYRQFYQIGAEIIGPPSAGSESPLRDAEVLEMLAVLLDRLGIKNWTLELNSVGCANDRKIYDEALRKALEPVKARMCADCQRRAVTNPLRVFDCKVPEDQPIIEKLPRISQYLDEPCREHFAAVQEILRSVGVSFVLNDRLVRGLDYYTRTAFEFTHGALGAQNAILGGGRYDGLSEALGGPKAPGIGFAIGEDRVVLALQEVAGSIAKPADVYIAPMGAGTNREAARLARELRQAGIVVDLGDESFRLKKSLETASKLGARFALIVGENEVQSGTFALKHLASGQQQSVPRSELAGRIKSGEQK